MNSKTLYRAAASGASESNQTGSRAAPSKYMSLLRAAPIAAALMLSGCGVSKGAQACDQTAPQSYANTLEGRAQMEYAAVIGTVGSIRAVELVGGITVNYWDTVFKAVEVGAGIMTVAGGLGLVQLMSGKESGEAKVSFKIHPK
jgi:hypothetical protein